MTNIDKGATYDNVRGVFADLDGGGLTDDEALAQIRKLVGATPPLPGVVTMLGTLPFTITIDTVTKEITEFEINYDFPNFERKIESRKEGAEIEVDETILTQLIEAANSTTGSWPEPERM